jgi:CRISPR-associated endonuclease Csn1
MPHEFGRAVAHLSQRRGFWSNRKSAARPGNDKEEGELKKAIEGLAASIQVSGSRTLGEYLHGLNSHDARRRTNKLSREMIHSEFDTLWTVQQEHLPDLLTDSLRKRIDKVIFYQRPLRMQKHLIGYCEILGHKHLKNRRRRAPKALLVSQRFRILQDLNNLRIILPDGRNIPLDAAEREKLLDALDRVTTKDKKLTFDQMRKLLKLDPSTCRFNLENENRKGLLGNETAHTLRRVFGKRWDNLSAPDKDKVVDDCRSIVEDETLIRRGVTAWKLSQADAEKLAKVSLVEGFSSLSRTALLLLVPELEAGASYAEAVQKLITQGKITPPPIPKRVRLERHGTLRNPMVDRALTELRKVVNGILREHGRPAVIRIELARDLKQTRRERADAVKKQAANSRENENASASLRENGIDNPSRDDIIKWKLWKECREVCPYTGKAISFNGLFGSTPEFDFEHIIPWTRSIDDSYMNRTLCDVRENRDVKHNQTPWEAYGIDSARYDQILQRVRCLPLPKRRRFEVRELDRGDRDFAARALNDTRYISLRAKNWLAEIVADDHAIEVSKGQATATVRRALGLNSILRDTGEKTRLDHRHHAVDALVIALTNRSTLHQLSRVSSGKQARPSFSPADLPWLGFREDAVACIDAINVSHRAQRKANGALHDETFYGFTGLTNERGQQLVAVRKPIAGLSPADIERIRDDRVRSIVKAHVSRFGSPANEGQRLVLPSRKGGSISIRKVRLLRPESAQVIGEGARKRHVLTSGNHHIEILEMTDNGGRSRREGKVVSTLEAMRRMRHGEPLIQRDHGPGKRFVMSLSIGEMIQADDGTLWRVQKMDRNCGIEIRPPWDANKGKDRVFQKKLNPNTLRGRKVTVSPTGRILPAND